MDTRTGRVLAVIAVFSVVFSVIEGRPETNFASSSITSDNTGTRSSHLVGNVPDSSSNSAPTTRIFSTKSGGSGGATILTRNGSGGSGATLVTGGSGSGGSGTGSASVLTGTSNGGVGVLTRSGPSGTQHVILGPNDNASVLGRFGSAQPSYVYPPYSGTGAGAGASAGGASSIAFAGPSGASASAGSRPSSNNYDYYDQ